MTWRDEVFDLLVLPPLVVAHCVFVFVLLCLYIFGADYVTFEQTAVGNVPRSVDLFLGFGVPFGLAIGAAWLNLRFILGKIARTETARIAGAVVIFAFAVAIPIAMMPVNLVIGCIVTSEKVGKSICL